MTLTPPISIRSPSTQRKVEKKLKWLLITKENQNNKKKSQSKKRRRRRKMSQTM